MRLARRLSARLLTGLVMIWVVASGTFFLVRLMPGDPVATAYEADIVHGMTPDQASAATALLYGFVPRQSLPRQYLAYPFAGAGCRSERPALGHLGETAQEHACRYPERRRVVPVPAG